MKKCEWCGDSFETSSPSAKYCCDNCRQAMARRKARDRRAEMYQRAKKQKEALHALKTCRRSRTIGFRVNHRPVPKGSISAIPGRRIFYNSSKIKEVSKLIRAAAQEAGVKLIEGGVIVLCEFFFKRPKSHLTSKGELRKGAPQEHTQKPDVDKLLRCVLDALTGVAYKDDSQVWEARGIKQFFDEDAIQIRLVFSEEVNEQDKWKELESKR